MEIIKTIEELRALLGYPSELVQNKTISRLDAHCRDFLAKSPLLVMSTSDRDGFCDASPRGDAPGFVLMLDDKRLLIPERPGNRRIDSLSNILSNPRVGLIFFIPGLEETLRINGRASIVQDPELLRQAEAHGRVPQLGIVVEVDECYVHCAKALKRSTLWQPDTWPEKGTLPSPARMIADHAKLDGVSADDITNMLHESYTKRLY